MPEVARTSTPFKLQDAAQAVADGLLLLGEQATQEQAGLLLAQVALETAQGKACNNNNPGNITANDKTYTGSYFRPLWFEPDANASARIKQLHELMVQGKAPRAFRAYSTLREGFLAYFRELEHDFKSLLAASRTGDPQDFADAIRSSGYTPDAPDSTASSIAKLQSEFINKGWFATLPLLQPQPDSPGAGSSFS